MQQHQNLYLCAALLAVSLPVIATCGDSHTKDPRTIGGRTYSTYIPRSADSNTALKFMPLVYKPCTDTWVFGLDAAVEYTRSFDGKDLAEGLFGSSTLQFEGTQSLKVQGRDRTTFALAADYFGIDPLLPVGTAILSFNPRIENINLHVQSYAGFDCWVKGLYAQVNFTFSHQKRDLFAGCDCQNDTLSTGTGKLPAGYMSAAAASSAGDLKTALSGNFLFGDMQTPWNYGKFKFCSMHKNAVAGVDVILGYDFWKTEAGSLGIYLQYTAPTGNKPCPTYVFSPVVGNGKHHEVGAGLRASCKLWENDCDETLVAYLDGHVTSLLKNHQLRSFDFINRGQNSFFTGTLSRYMLLKELTANANSTEYDYAGHLINAINFTTRNVAVRVPVKGDATLRFIYTRGCFDFGFGYNIYGQSHEKIGNLDASCNADIANKTYGLKGANGVYYFDYVKPPAVNVLNQADPFAVASNATSSAAMFGNTPGGLVDSQVSASHGAISTTGSIKAVDWTAATSTRPVPNGVNADSLFGIITTGNVLLYPDGYYSNPATAVTTADLDKESGKAPRQLTHKGFVTMNYTWKYCSWEPYIGAGAEVEGGRRITDLRQWGVWVKGGFSF